MKTNNIRQSVYIENRNWIMANLSWKPISFLSLYIILNELTDEYGRCTAPNSYLAKRVGVSPEQVENILTDLWEIGFISIYTDPMNTNIRNIYISQYYAVTRNSQDDKRGATLEFILKPGDKYGDPELFDDLEKNIKLN